MWKHDRLLDFMVIVLVAILGFFFLLMAWSSNKDPFKFDQQIDARLEAHGVPLTENAFVERVKRSLAAIVAEQEAAKSEAQAKRIPPVTEDDHVYGAADAPIVLVEYSDFNCPYCRSFHDTAKQVVDGSDGKVKWVYRYFPLRNYGESSVVKAAVAECAAQLGGNESFWAAADYLFSDEVRLNFGPDEVVAAAETLGLDKEAFNECMTSNAPFEVIQAHAEGAAKAGVSATPGNYLINTETNRAISIPGAQPLLVVENAVKSLLEQDASR